MASLNKVYLIGNLTRDPEIRVLTTGQAVGDLRMAVNRKYRGANGEDHDETCFVAVVVWGKQAEASGKYLSKGSPLLVEGRLQYDEWEKDGQKHNRIRVVAERVQFLSAPKRSAGYDDGPGPSTDGGGQPERRPEPSSPVSNPPPVSEGAAGGAGDADDLPF